MEGHTVQVACTTCGARGRAKPQLVARTVRCPRCQGTLRVAAQATASDAARPDSAALPTLRARLKLLQARLASPELALGPRRSEAALKVLERIEGYRLPGEYRAFLLDVGDGGAFGPRHGLRSLGAGSSGVPEAERARQQARQRATFSFAGPRCWAQEEIADQARQALRRASRDGVLELGSEGCGIDWVLVLTGPHRGQVWLRTEDGVAPAPGNPGFVAWLERLLGPDRQWWKEPIDGWGDPWSRHAPKLRDQAMCAARPPRARLEPLQCEAPLCVDCAAWLAARSRQDGRVRCVVDPLEVTVFEPDAPPVTLPHAAECA